MEGRVFFFQAEDGIRDSPVTGVQTCALPIFGIEHSARHLTTYDLLIDDATLEDAIQPTIVPELSVVPSSVDLSGAELELIDLNRREFRLATAVRRAQTRFDYILIDCPDRKSTRLNSSHW